MTGFGGSKIQARKNRGFLGGGAGFPVNTLEGSWVASTYSGSGNLLNTGTEGATADMVPFSGANPVWNAGSLNFSLGGNQQGWLSAADVPNFNILPTDNVTMGVIVSVPAASQVGGTYIGKLDSGTFTTAGWRLKDNSNLVMNGIEYDVNAVHLVQTSTTPPSMSTGVKQVLYWQQDGTGRTILVGKLLDSITAPTKSGATSNAGMGTISNTTKFGVCRDFTSNTGVIATFYGAFFTKALLSDISLKGIAATYGL